MISAGAGQSIRELPRPCPIPRTDLTQLEAHVASPCIGEPVGPPSHEEAWQDSRPHRPDKVTQMSTRPDEQ